MLMKRIIRRFEFDVEITPEGLADIKDIDIIYEIIHGIFYGIASGSETVDLFEIKTLDNNQMFSISRKKWIKALDKCMNAMIEIEDYETCQEIKKALNILSY